MVEGLRKVWDFRCAKISQLRNTDTICTDYTPLLTNITTMAPEGPSDDEYIHHLPQPLSVRFPKLGCMCLGQPSG